MTRDEFMLLPQAVRLEVVYRALHDRLVTMPVPGTTSAPTTPSAPTPTGDVRSPKYDARVPRRGGFVFASEMLLADLEWWHAKKLEGAASGGKYAQKDKKLADELARFIAWRRVAPADTWRGVRGDAAVTAEPPSRDAALREWGDRPPAQLAPPPPSGGYSDADYGPGDVDEIPF